MKPSKLLRSFLLAAGSSLLAISSASAADGTYNSQTGAWNVAGSWTSGIADGADSTAFFTNDVTTSDRSTSLGADRTIGNIEFTDATNTAGNGFNRTITGNTLTLDVTSGAPIINVTQSNRTLTISSQISGSDGLTKSGTGNLTLSGNNNYTGLTTINSGSITLGNNNNALGSSAAGSETTINGGTSNVTNLTNSAVLDLGANARTLSESFNLNGSATGRATINNTSNVNHVLNGNIDVTSDAGNAQIRSEIGSITVNGDITGTLTGLARFALRGATTSTSNRVLGSVDIGTGTLTKFDSGTWTIGASSKTYAWGATDVVQGTLTMGVANVLPSATVVTLGQTNSTATLDLNGSSQTVAGIQIVATPGTGTKSITSSTAATLSVGSASDFTYGGVLTGSLALTKTGAGTQTLTNTNTYSGATQINAGTLAVNGGGSINNSAVTVNGGTFLYNSSVAYSGTLTFTSGTIAGTNLTGSLGNQTIGANKTISPGNSPGTMSTSGQTWAADGSYLWEINSATGTAGSDPGWDLVSGTGTLDITATSANPYDILVTSLTLGNLAGDAANFSDMLDYNWLIADFASITGFDETDFFVNTTAFDNLFTGEFGISLGGGALPGDNSQIYLTYTAIPEPGAALLGSLGLLALLRRRR